MANFNLNINAQLIPGYTKTTQLRNYDLCSGAIDNTYTVALTEGTPADLKIALLNTCTSTLKTLHITPVAVTNPSAVFFKYNTTPLTTIGVTTDIDITGLSITDVISLLTMEVSTLVAISDGITMDIAITDIGDITYPAVRSKFIVAVDDCPAPAEPAYGDIATVTPQVPCELGQVKVFSLNAPAYSTVRIRYYVLSSGNHGFTGAMYETDTLDGVSTTYISGFTGSTGYTKDILINMGGSTKRYYRACIEAKPPIIAADNICTIWLTLRNAANTADIGTIILTDTETWA